MLHIGVKLPLRRDEGPVSHNMEELSFRTEVNDSKSVSDLILGTQGCTVHYNVVSVTVVWGLSRYR